MLPKIEHPIISIKIPSTKKQSNFRPWLVKEEKLLLMAKETAKETKSMKDILSSVKQIVNNCSLDKNFDVDKLAIFDLEYIFLKLRAASVDNISVLSYMEDNDPDKHVYEFEIDLNSVEIKYPEKIDPNIKVNKDIAIMMKYPPASLYDDEEFLKSKEPLFELICKCIDKIANKDEIIECKDHTPKEISEFLESLDNKTYVKIQDFLTQIPSIEHVITYPNKKGQERKIVLRSLNDFFTFV